MKHSLQGARVIIADDCPAIRRGLRSLLERRGFGVVGEASNGQEAFELARRVYPDAVVLDLTMPVMDGFEAARKIADVCPRTKLVAVTTHAEDHYVLAALEAGIAGYVLKSRAAEELVEAINTVREGKFHVATVLASGLVEAWLAEHTPH